MLNEAQYYKTEDIVVQRHSQPSLHVQAASGYYIKSVFCNQENVTHLVKKGVWTMQKVEKDMMITVLFARDNGVPLTGDTFTVLIAILLIVLSALGLIACVINVRKHM